MTDDFWADYEFLLVPGPAVSRITACNINRSTQPYTEAHGKEKGVVFFPTLEAARAYQRSKSLDQFNVVRLPGSAGALVSMSLSWWGCNVAYSIRIDGDTFRRDVTKFVADEVSDGSHRHKAGRQW